MFENKKRDATSDSEGSLKDFVVESEEDTTEESDVSSDDDSGASDDSRKATKKKKPPAKASKKAPAARRTRGNAEKCTYIAVTRNWQTINLVLFFFVVQLKNHRQNCRRPNQQKLRIQPNGGCNWCPRAN